MPRIVAFLIRIIRIPIFNWKPKLF